MSPRYVSVGALKFSDSPMDEKPRITAHKGAEKQLGVAKLTSKYEKALFLFRRDLRLKDNTRLINASKASETVVPAFIFDPSQQGQILTSVITHFSL
jgi:hypothetical protein